ncbi:hypothetical protein I4U23_001141 [Adineta vaga]|nr:hypothetical protein I4U23_001141 [Adineta vaga]
MPTKTTINEYEQLITLLNQLMSERDILFRENEYLKAKLNESILIETVHEMKKERDYLLKLLSNLTTKYHHENNVNSVYGTMSDKSINQNNSTLSHQNRSLAMTKDNIHRVKANLEQQQQQQQRSKVIYRADNRKDTLDRLSSSSSTTTPLKSSQTSKRMFFYKAPQTLFRKPDIQLKHSLNSPFQHYRSQSLQNLS